MFRALRYLPACLCLLASAVQAQTFSIHGATDKDVAIYQPGEPIVFTLQVLDDGKAVAGNKLTWTRTGDDGKTEKGEGIADENGLKVTTTIDQPGFVRLQARAVGEDGKELQGPRSRGGVGAAIFDGGACVEPEKLTSIPEPEDFDAFWQGMKATLDAVPIKAERKELPSKNPKVKIYAVSIDCAGPRPVTGYLTIPADAEPKSLPGICEFHGYGFNKHNPPGNPRGGAIILNINAHGMELGREDEYYATTKKSLQGYCFRKDENQDPKTTYYYGMSMRVMRALQYVKSLPEWNGKELQSNGGSQGGLQGLWGAGLDPDVTSASIWSPWSCDFGGITVGRMRGWRPDYTRALDYYDPVFHAKRIKGKVHLIANYGDYTCAPSGVWIVYNNIPHDSKSMEVNQGCTHSFRMKQRKVYTISPAGVANVRLAD